MFIGKFRKQSSQQRSSLIEAIMVSVDNLSETMKQRYKELAVFLDDKSVPKKVKTSLIQLDRCNHNQSSIENLLISCITIWNVLLLIGVSLEDAYL